MLAGVMVTEGEEELRETVKLNVTGAESVTAPISETPATRGLARVIVLPARGWTVTAVLWIGLIRLASVPPTVKKTRVPPREVASKEKKAVVSVAPWKVITEGVKMIPAAERVTVKLVGVGELTVILLPEYTTPTATLPGPTAKATATVLCPTDNETGDGVGTVNQFAFVPDNT